MEPARISPKEAVADGFKPSNSYELRIGDTIRMEKSKLFSGAPEARDAEWAEGLQAFRENRSVPLALYCYVTLQSAEDVELLRSIK